MDLLFLSGSADVGGAERSLLDIMASLQQADGSRQSTQTRARDDDLQRFHLHSFQPCNAPSSGALS